MRGAAAIAMVLAAGCYSPSPAVGVPCSATGECPAGQHCNRLVSPPTCAPADAGPIDGPPDAPASCGTSEDCAPAAPVCDMSTQTCRACYADAECSDGVCVEHIGQCVNGSNVLFVAPTSTANAPCTRAMPCTLDAALLAVANNQKTIAFADGMYAAPVQVSPLSTSSLTLSGPDRDPTGVAFTAGLFVESGTKEIVVEGVTISNMGGRAVDNRGSLTLSRVALTTSVTGLVTTNQNRLRVWDSVVTANSAIGIDVAQTPTEILRTVVHDNDGGGISVNNAATTIESSVVADNGGLLAQFGGVRYQNLNGRPQVFRFNTVAENSTSLAASGVVCPGAEVVLESSIFVGGGTTNVISQACVATYSLFSGTAVAGTGNISGDPAFVGADDFHIGPTSAAREAADPAATTARDIDNEIRPLGGGRDIGADEIP